jgi:hypothetical protein
MTVGAFAVVGGERVLAAVGCSEDSATRAAISSRTA